MKNLIADVPVGTGHFSPSSSAVVAVRKILATLHAAWIVRCRHAQAMRELQAFTDRELQDLGLTRYDVSALIHGTYRGD